jgi:hypothetical protein
LRILWPNFAPQTSRLKNRQWLNFKLAERETSRLAAVGHAKGFENQARVSTVRRAADGDRPRSVQIELCQHIYDMRFTGE